MNRLIQILFFSLMCLLLTTPLLAEKSAYIGKVAKVSPDAMILRDGQTLVANKNLEIFANDLFQTGPTGTLGIIFRDGTILTIGPSSEFHIRDYVFVPLEKKTSFLGRMRQGSLSYISGAMGRMNPDSVRIETPTAYLGLRGTKVLVQVD